MEMGELTPPIMLPNCFLPNLTPLDDVVMDSSENMREMTNVTKQAMAQKEKRVCRSPPLRHWLNQHRDHPYPTKQEKEALALDANLSISQVCNWFANARRRLKISTTSGDNATVNHNATVNRTPIHQPHSINMAQSHPVDNVRVDGAQLANGWLPQPFAPGFVWPMPVELDMQQRPTIPVNEQQQSPQQPQLQQPQQQQPQQQPPQQLQAGAVDLRVKRMKPDMDSAYMLPDNLINYGQLATNIDFNPTGITQMNELLYLHALNGYMAPCSGLPGCVCVQCREKWFLASKQINLSCTEEQINAVSVDAQSANYAVMSESRSSPLPAGHPGKFKQAMMHRYLEDSEQSAGIKHRRQSGSLGSEDSDGHSSSECTSPSSKDHVTSEDMPPLTSWPVPGNSVENEDLYWKEIVAALALTTMSKSHTLRSDQHIGSSSLTPGL